MYQRAAGRVTSRMALPVPVLRDQPVAVPFAALMPGAWLLALLGIVPVTLIAVSTFGVGLRGLAAVVALPATVTLAVLAVRDRETAALAGAALLAGVAATAVYDLSRAGFMWAGAVEHDPIPHIGEALGLHPAVVFGYLWRYLGNGTGLALAFLALGLRGIRAGVVYGLAVCGGLLVTLAVSPLGQEMLFPLTPGTVVMATTGHAIYGAVVGALAGGPLRRRVAGPEATAEPACRVGDRVGSGRGGPNR